MTYFSYVLVVFEICENEMKQGLSSLDEDTREVGKTPLLSLTSCRKKWASEHKPKPGNKRCLAFRGTKELFSSKFDNFPLEMLAFAVSAPFSFKLPRVFQLSPHNTTIPERRRPTVFSYKTHQHILLPHHYKLKPRLLSDRSVLTRLSNDGSGAIDATPPWSSPPVSC